MIWHSASLTEVLNELSVDKNNGLANGEAAERLENYGKNEIDIVEKKSLIKRFLAQFKSKTLICLIIVSIVSLIASLFYELSRPFMPLLLIGIVVANAVISAFHLHLCDTTFDGIKSITNPMVKVLRDGIEKTVSSENLVRGDIILLSEGDYVTADARLIEAYELRCNESALTGEEVPVEKNADAILEDITSFESRSNMVFAGTTVVHGNAKAVVVATAYDTENGKTAAINEQIGSKKLPIESELDTIGKFINISILVVCLLVFAINLIQNLSVSTQTPFAVTTISVVLNALALAVAAIPESLPAIATIVIAIGTGRILKDKIIVKENKAFETIGKTNVIITDKTGVLTHKDMELVKVFDGKEMFDLGADPINESVSVLLRLAAVCSTLYNDSTEKAIKKACFKYNSITETDLLGLMPKISHIPFDSARKSMTVITMINEKPYAIVKGAPEILAHKCNNCNAEEILKLNEQLANEGYRNVCIAMRPLSEIPANPQSDEIECNLTFIGLLSLKESIRKSAIDEIKLCKSAKIHTVMVTGDNLNTAKSIAIQLGILSDDSQAITGAELQEMSDEQLVENIHKYTVFARILPSDKLRIVKAWQTRKAVVTVTGDSLSDADSLATADVGCAIGQYGTDVAKGNADIIILKNNFGSIVSAIKESRGFFSNIKKAVYYLLSCNIAELLLVLFGVIIFGNPILVAAQLLLINLLTDCAPAISFSMEKAENSVMKKRSFEKVRRILEWKALTVLLLQSLCIAVLVLVSYGIGTLFSQAVATTMAFATLGIAQGIHCFNNKLEGSIFNKEVFSNSFMNKAVFTVLFVVVFLVFSPIGGWFGLTVLSFGQFLIALGLAAVILPFSELLKYLKKKI